MAGESTYCNPLALPDYPRGKCSFRKQIDQFGWTQGIVHDFRETADPSAIYHEGRWYLYPSAGMAYVSDDLVTWHHHRMTPYDIGYAPTVARHRGRFYLTACHAGLWVADDPLGPFHEVGAFVDRAGEPITDWSDPMLFADDGELYAYWGLAGDGIKGARLDGDDPRRMVTDRKVLFAFDPSHEWERRGDHNEDISTSFVEGPWMFRHEQRYYLTYTAPGTEWRTYGMGCYISENPLGPFTYQPRNPILLDRHGLVHGPGHGCIVRGPGQTIWAFYTCLGRTYHAFERRVGVDPAGIDAEGNLFVRGASEIPQLAPGTKEDPHNGNGAGWLALTTNKPVRASSHAPGRTCDYINDEHNRTWWQPADDDHAPWIEIDLMARYEIRAIRLMFAEPGLDYDHGVIPGAVRYVLESATAAEREKAEWSIVLDRSTSDEDRLIDYRQLPSTLACRLRLRLLGWPKGMSTGVSQLTVFGVARPQA